MTEETEKLQMSQVVLVEEEFVERWKRLRLVWKEKYGDECRGR